MDSYISKIKSEEEFKEKFHYLYNTLSQKENRSTAENALFGRLNRIKDYLEKGVPLISRKGSYNNLVPFSQMGGGMELLNSELCSTIADVLFYFTQNY